MKGFTLLEMMLAVSLGAVLMLVAVGMMVTIDRTDRALSVRHGQAMEMATMHRVMDRAFSNLLMASESQAAVEMQNRAGIIGGEALRPPRPRLLLEEDVALAARGMQAQRLELVVSRAPVPPGFGRDQLPTIEEQMMSGPTRGVFEVRPDDDGMALWWRPLPRDEGEPDGYRFQLDPREDEYAVRLATGLLEARWIAFKSRERQGVIEAMVSHDLPAHMELHVRMSSGFAAQWMFEVQWINGPETAEELAAEQEREQELPGGVGGPGGPGAGGSGGSGGSGGERGPRGGGRNIATPVPGSDGGQRR